MTQQPSEEQQHRHDAPPNNQESEKALLSCMLVDNRCIPAVIAKLDDSDFYNMANRIVFEALRRLYDYDGQVDQITAREWIEETGNIEKMGGVMYLAELATNGMASAANVKLYVKNVLDASLRRQVIERSLLAIKDARTGAKSGTEVAEEHATKLLEVSARSTERTFMSMYDVIAEVSDEAERAVRLKRDVAGLNGGMWAINHYINGFCNSELTLLAARPSIGKSTLARQLAVSIAENEKVAVGIFSIEMSRRQMGQCLACAYAPMSLRRMRRGTLHEDEWLKFTQAQARLSRLPIYIDDTSGLTIPQARAAMQRMTRQHNIRFWIFDYLQLMQGEGRNRESQVNYLSINLKKLSREFDVPVLALSQLSRACEARDDRRPQMQDLRDSGGLEQDADNVILLYRPGFYEHLVRRCRAQGKDVDALISSAYFLFPKTRFSEPGSSRLLWNPHRVMFENPAVQRDEEQPPPPDEIDDLFAQRQQGGEF